MGYASCLLNERVCEGGGGDAMGRGEMLLHDDDDDEHGAADREGEREGEETWRTGMEGTVTLQWRPTRTVSGRSTPVHLAALSPP